MDNDTQGYAIRDAVADKPELPSLDDWPGGQLLIDGQMAFLLGVKEADRRPLAVNVLVLGLDECKNPQVSGRQSFVASKHAVLLRDATETERTAHHSGGRNTGLATIEYLEFIEKTSAGLSFRRTGEVQTYVIM